ncbi:hypothetical protein ACROYT_G033012 [Oculina patagonica]
MIWKRENRDDDINKPEDRMYKVQISNIKGDFSLPTTLSKVDRGVLLTVPNPQYTEVISQHQHLKGVMMDDEDTKQDLPIHVILGAIEYAKQHLESLKIKYLEEVVDIMKSLYVDDVIGGAHTVDQGCNLKEVAVSWFELLE